MSTTKPQYIRMKPGESLLLLADNNRMVVECQAMRGKSVLLYRPPTDEELNWEYL